MPSLAKNDKIPFKGVLFYAENPAWAFTQILRIADTLNKDIVAGIHPKSYVLDKAFIGKNVHIGANATIEKGTFIGDNNIRDPNVYIGRMTAWECFA
jgi:UDP-3-O-[3-hydroxymyristoyl] glucosamine N-acyltransferase